MFLTCSIPNIQTITDMNISPFIGVAIVCMTVVPSQAAESIKSTVSELADTLAALNTQLDGIKDKESATAAAPEIEKVATKFAALSLKLMNPAGLTPPTPEEAQEMPAIQKKMLEINTKFQANLMRIQQGGFITPELEKAFMALQPKTPAPAPAPVPANGGDAEKVAK